MNHTAKTEFALGIMGKYGMARWRRQFHRLVLRQNPISFQEPQEAAEPPEPPESKEVRITNHIHHYHDIRIITQETARSADAKGEGSRIIERILTPNKIGRFIYMQSLAAKALRELEAGGGERKAAGRIVPAGSNSEDAGGLTVGEMKREPEHSQGRQQPFTHRRQGILPVEPLTVKLEREIGSRQGLDVPGGGRAAPASASAGGSGGKPFMEPSSAVRDGSMNGAVPAANAPAGSSGPRPRELTPALGRDTLRTLKRLDGRYRMPGPAAPAAARAARDPRDLPGAQGGRGPAVFALAALGAPLPAVPGGLAGEPPASGGDPGFDRLANASPLSHRRQGGGAARMTEPGGEGADVLLDRPAPKLVLRHPEKRAAAAEPMPQEAYAPEWAAAVQGQNPTAAAAPGQSAKAKLDIGAEEVKLLAEQVYQVLDKRIGIQKDRRGLR